MFPPFAQINRMGIQPWKSLLRIKVAQIELTDELLMRHAVLMARVNAVMVSGSKADVNELLDEISTLEVEIEQAAAPKAFSSLSDPKLANQLRMASEYDDVWIDIGDMCCKSWYFCDELGWRYW